MKLIKAILISIVLQFAVIYLPFLQKAFGTTSLVLVDWLSIFIVSASILVFAETLKFISKRERVKR